MAGAATTSTSTTTITSIEIRTSIAATATTLAATDHLNFHREVEAEISAIALLLFRQTAQEVIGNTIPITVVAHHIVTALLQIDLEAQRAAILLPDDRPMLASNLVATVAICRAFAPGVAALPTARVDLAAIAVEMELVIPH